MRPLNQLRLFQNISQSYLRTGLYIQYNRNQESAFALQRLLSLPPSVRDVDSDCQKKYDAANSGPQIGHLLGLCGYFLFLDQTSSKIVAALEGGDVQLLSASRSVLRDCFLDGCCVHHIG